MQKTLKIQWQLLSLQTYIYVCPQNGMSLLLILEVGVLYSSVIHILSFLLLLILMQFASLRVASHPLSSIFFLPLTGFQTLNIITASDLLLLLILP